MSLRPSILLATLLLSLGFCSHASAEPARDADELQRAIDDAIADGDARLVLEPGEYRGPGVDGAVLTIRGASDLEIVADGVRLVATTLHAVVSIQESENLVLRGLTIDHDPLPFTQGDVIAVGDDGRTFDVRVHAGHDVFEGTGRRAIIYDGTSGRVKPGAWTRYNASVEEVSDGVLRVGMPRSMNDTLAVGDQATLTKPTLTPHGILVYDSRGCTLEDVVIHAATTFAVFERGGGSNAYVGCRVEPGPAPGDQPRLLSSNADGIHSKHTDVGPRIEDCHFEAMGDDGIAINGDYALILDVDPDGGVTIVTKRDPTFFAGDRVHAFNESGKRTDEARVASLEPVTWGGETSAQEVLMGLYPEMRKAETLFRDTYRLELESPLDLEPGDLLSSPDRNGSGFAVVGNTIRNHRARGILVKASDGVLADNDIAGSSMCGILMAPEVDFWMETDFSSNVVIRGNRIADTGHAASNPGSAYAGAITIVARGTGGFWPAGGHAGIRIEGNEIANPAGPAIVLSSAADVAIAGNRFVRPGHGDSTTGSRLGIDPHALIWIANARDVSLSDNVISEAGPNLESTVATSGDVERIQGADAGVATRE